MLKSFKIDLHTHPISALKEEMGVNGIRDINIQVASRVVKAVKAAGLNGIAITEHNNFNHGWVACLQIFEHFRSENLIIIPGLELDFSGQQILQLYVPPIYRKRIPFFKGKEWFNILVHPGLYNPLETHILDSVSLDAIEERSLKGYFEASYHISKNRNIPLVQASDAHSLQEMGSYYMEFQVC
jgi:hypothetical protein